MNKIAIQILAAEREAEPSPTCPLCHTADTTVSHAALSAGASWKCVRCGHRWDAERLETAAAYAAMA
jgi:transposase-like protein